MDCLHLKLVIRIPNIQIGLSSLIFFCSACCSVSAPYESRSTVRVLLKIICLGIEKFFISYITRTNFFLETCHCVCIASTFYSLVGSTCTDRYNTKTSARYAHSVRSIFIPHDSRKMQELFLHTPFTSWSETHWVLCEGRNKSLYTIRSLAHRITVCLYIYWIL